jgi:hypothetical protein
VCSPHSDREEGGGSFGWTDPASKTVRATRDRPSRSRWRRWRTSSRRSSTDKVDDLAGYRQHRERMEIEAEASACLIHRWLVSGDTPTMPAFPGYIGLFGPIRGWSAWPGVEQAVLCLGF